MYYYVRTKILQNNWYEKIRYYSMEKIANHTIMYDFFSIVQNSGTMSFWKYEVRKTIPHRIVPNPLMCDKVVNNKRMDVQLQTNCIVCTTLKRRQDSYTTDVTLS